MITVKSLHNIIKQSRVAIYSTKSVMDVLVHGLNTEMCATIKIKLIKTLDLTVSYSLTILAAISELNGSTASARVFHKLE